MSEKILSDRICICKSSYISLPPHRDGSGFKLLEGNSYRVVSYYEDGSLIAPTFRVYSDNDKYITFGSMYSTFMYDHIESRDIKLNEII